MREHTSALQREIQQTRPFRSLGQEAVLAMFRTSDLMQRRLARVLAPSGVTQQQYNVLRILRGAGPDGLPTLAIGDRMIERTPGVTRLIDRLAAKGWVCRQRAEDDRRRVDCRITDDGLELLASLDEPMDRIDDELLGMLSLDQQRTLVDLLDRIRAGLQDGELG